MIASIYWFFASSSNGHWVLFLSRKSVSSLIIKLTNSPASFIFFFCWKTSQFGSLYSHLQSCQELPPAVKAKRQLSRQLSRLTTTMRSPFSRNDQSVNHRLRLKLSRSSNKKCKKWCSRCFKCIFILWLIVSSLWKPESASFSSRSPFPLRSSSPPRSPSPLRSLLLRFSHLQKIAEELRILKHSIRSQITFIFSWIGSEILQLWKTIA